MMARPVRIGDTVYPRRADALAVIQAVLRNNRDHVPITGSDDQMLRDLLERHPDAGHKAGSGIAWFEARPNPVFPSKRGFWIVRTDGSETDFSFMKCLDGKNRIGDIRHALRRAVVDQVLEFKRTAFAGNHERRCPVSSEMITADRCHVDHMPPVFLDIATAWVRREGGEGQIALTDSADGTIGCELADAEQRRRWEAFHRHHARLQVVSPWANLSAGKRARRVTTMEESP